MSNDKVNDIAISLQALKNTADAQEHKKSSAAIIATLDQLLENERISIQNIFIYL